MTFSERGKQSDAKRLALRTLHSPNGTPGGRIERRALLAGLGSLIFAAPAIVRASSLMQVKVVEWVPLALPVGEKPHAGWIERLAFKAMDNVLKAGWTPERATPFYGGLSEGEMRSAVAYARQHGFLK